MGRVDVDAALDQIELTLPEWLEVNDEARGLLLEFVEKGKARGLKVSKVIDKWRELYPEAPAQEAQNTKKWLERVRAGR